ncbi:putative MFS family arabinose efflux permease [Trichococcus patagoniensis]|uniref:Putative MFS family arabinose efflux permease n=1 Tax=Trichococcus patagoniensis TaxID=382641 RepID=A0A2T5IGL2_9LACT|nr:MFS transporter [Trichococcus patagoniensis]PTQ82932.1 putative MFS family arabinose efflux permease [Trichococcus patagoniensis]
METKSLKKLALLSASFVVVSGGAIAVNVPAIARDFPEIPLQLVESLTTMPSLFLILSVLFSHAIAQRIGYKKTVLLGLLTVLVSGLIPIFIHNFWIIFISRAFFGLGIGLFNSLLVSFIRYSYVGAERAAMIGLQSAFEGIGGMSISFLVGQLLKIDWQTSFWVYLSVLPALFLFATLVPDIPSEQEAVSGKYQESDLPGKRRNRMSREVLGYLALLVVAVMFYMTITVRVTPLMLVNGYGDATDGSGILALIGIGAMTAGFLFGRVFAAIGKYTLPFALFGMGLALVTIGLSNAVWVTGLAAAFCGFSFRNFIPYLFNKVNSTASGNANTATSLLLVGFNLGAAFSPYGIVVMETIFRLSSERGIFFLEGALLLVFGAIGTGYHFLSRG